ncbi:MAG: hypothetical protein JJU12_05465 [Chlamydiales bacterium]|nr:hypothetical protein [Chlamydiales bacterium]
MRTFIVFASFLLAFSSTLTAASNTFMDYQNYNHGYCPDCNCFPCKCPGGVPPSQNPGNPQGTCPKPNPCCPPATTACTQCGLNIVYIGLGIAVLATAATIIIGSGNGTVHNASAP